MKRRTVRTIRSRAADEAQACRRDRDREAAWAVIATAKDHAGIVASITQHWFRHKLATDILSLTGDLRGAMAQGGWRDVDSVIGYVHDLPERPRREQSTDRRHSFDTSWRDFDTSRCHRRKIQLD
jgi:hypothetical protein